MIVWKREVYRTLGAIERLLNDLARRVLEAARLDPIMRPWTPLVLGAALGGVTCALLTFVPRPQGIALLALILVAAGWVYVGAALSDGRSRFVVLEIGLALVFLALAFIGLWYSPWALVIGFVGHGIWDWFHEHPENERQAGAPVRALWYPPACVGYDWLVALFIVDWYLLGGAF